MRRTVWPTLSLLVLWLALPGAPARGAEGPPSFSLRFLGSGSVVAINNVGTVVGVRTSAASGAQTPLVSAAGLAWEALPLPSGASGAFPTDVNDSGVIVGVGSFSSGRRAVRWRPAGAGYDVEVLPLLPGELASYATAVNNLGQVVGARAGILGTPYGFGWLYTDADGLVDLNAAYGWFATPGDISDAGVILSGTQTFDLSTRTVTDVGLSGPTNYNAVGGVALNDAGQILGAASLKSTSLNIVSVFRYAPGTGWEFIAGTSRYTAANDINSGGDVCWGEQGAGIFLEGIGAFALGGLLEPAVAAAGWAVTGNGCLLNDQRVVATVGRNSVSGESGAVLLTPVGALSPPTAPADLRGVAHAATRMEPYNSIDLTWVNTSLLSRGYELQRREAGTATWASLSLVPPGTATSHVDTTVGAGAIYEYRVRATGLGGASEWSNTATVTSPAVPLDTAPPTVSILSPASGASVSGVVSVSAQAGDDVGVELLELSYWNQYLGRQVLLGSVSGAESLVVSWDTRGLTPATYTLRAYAHDAMGNWSQAEIPVTVSAASGGTMKVSSISLSGTRHGGTVRITGDVLVLDGAGRAVPDAVVSARWTLPSGGSAGAKATTSSSGRARFSTAGPRGTYVLAVTGVSKAGYLFDSAGSVLTKSITR
jgi:hypothetical protein